MTVKRIGIYALSIVLVCFYLYEFFCWRGENLSEDYEAYILTGERKYYTAHMEEYTADVKCDFRTSGNYYNMGQGWTEPVEDGTWMEGNESVLFFVLSPEQIAIEADYELALDVIWDYHFGKEVYVNDQYVGEMTERSAEIDLQTDPQEVGVATADLTEVILIPGLVFKEGVNRIAIRTKQDIYEFYGTNTATGTFVSGVELRSLP